MKTLEGNAADQDLKQGADGLIRKGEICRPPLWSACVLSSSATTLSYIYIKIRPAFRCLHSVPNNIPLCQIKGKLKQVSCHPGKNITFCSGLLTQEALMRAAHPCMCQCSQVHTRIYKKRTQAITCTDSSRFFP